MGVPSGGDVVAVVVGGVVGVVVGGVVGSVVGGVVGGIVGVVVGGVVGVVVGGVAGVVVGGVVGSVVVSSDSVQAPENRVIERVNIIKIKNNLFISSYAYLLYFSI